MESQALTVSTLNNYLKNYIDSDPFFSNILVEGEISNFTYNQSGHIYFTLKDEQSQISCVMFKSYAQYLNIKLKDGLKIYCKCNLTVYSQGGRYQLYVTSIKEKGLGDLYQKYEELKKKLELKGYFDKDHKKPLPKFPKNIALLTSQTGAVIEDLKSIILKRSQFSNLILIPTKVQGEDAKYDIVKNIKLANEDPIIDVIILARGGGSLEDLWPFNEEIVADAIYESSKPIISAIGHETDFSISDFTADLRAATPSDAALMVVLDNKDLLNELIQQSTRLKNAYTKIINDRMQYLMSIQNKIIFKEPERVLINYKQSLINLSNKLELLSPINNIKNIKEKFDKLQLDLNKAYTNNINNLKNEFYIINNKLNLLNPLSILSKGYSVTYKDNRIIKSKDELEESDLIETRFIDGFIKSRVVKE